MQSSGLSIVYRTPKKYENLFIRMIKNQFSQAITISPPKMDNTIQVEEFQKNLFYLLSGLDYVFVGEFDNDLRWHYHGVIIGGGATYTLKDYMVKHLECFVDVGNNGKHIRPDAGWFTYMCKDLTRTMGILDTLEYPVYLPTNHKVKFNVYDFKEITANQAKPDHTSTHGEPESLCP